MTRVGRALRALARRLRGAEPAPAAPRPLEAVDRLEERGRFLRLIVDLTDRCNLKCVMCHFSLPGRRQGQHELTLADFERLAPGLLPHVAQLGLSCATEPFLSRDFLPVLRFARERGVPRIYFITNATQFTAEAVDELIALQIDQVTLSLDGATRETFEAIRRGADFERVLANIRSLRDRKRELGSELPRLQFNLTLMRQNVEELEDWLRLVAELGAGDVDLRHAVPLEGLPTHQWKLDGHKELTNRCLRRARALAAELGLALVNCPDDFALEEPIERDAAPEPPAASHLREPCRLPWEMALLHPDGGVIPCTNWFTHEWMGNVRQQPFPEIWNGEQYRRLREQLLTGELGENCRVCPAMGYGSVDREESFSQRRV